MLMKGCCEICGEAATPQNINRPIREGWAGFDVHAGLSPKTALAPIPTSGTTIYRTPDGITTEQPTEKGSIIDPIGYFTPFVAGDGQYREPIGGMKRRK